MTKYGLKSLDINYIVDRDNLKRYFLYFDKIYFDRSSFEISKMVCEPIAKIYFESLDIKEQIKMKSAEIDFLQEEGLLIEFKNRNLEKEAYRRNYKDFMDHYEEHKDKGSSLFSSVDTMYLSSNFKTFQNIIYGQEGNPDDAYQSCFNSILLSRINNTDITPIFEDGSLVNDENRGKEYKILTFILNKLPVVDDSVCWEAIIDLKADNDTKLSFMRLRNWMIDISNSTNLDQSEVEEKYEYLFNEYKTNFERHKMKSTKDVFKTVFFTTAETVENLATFKWSKIVKDLYSIFDSQMSLAEFESNAPGKELGFIYRANNKFKK